jgi:dynein heavy chain 2
MLNQEMLVPYTSRDYGLREFKKDLKGYLEQAGAQNKQCVLFMEDHVLLQNPAILETVNSLIASGQISGLFMQDEVERLFQNPEEVRREYYGKTLYEAFFERCRKNLKVVLSMDYTNKDFAHNCAANPALFTKCTIIWMPALSKDSMAVFINEELKEVVLHTLQPKEKEEFISQAVGVHRIGIDNGASPRSFLALLQSYKSIFLKKTASRGSQASHLKTGLSKLNEAKELVDKLTSEA